MRGDRPQVGTAPAPTTVFTPHARGSTSLGQFNHRMVGVYPACAGIDLLQIWSAVKPRCLPRMRGDRPTKRRSKRSICKFTPHARGSTFNCHTERELAPVYPACAGIDLGLMLGATTGNCLPRMRGDRPSDWGIWVILARFTPHARGSTR